MYLTVNYDTRTVTTNKPKTTGLETQLAAAAAAIMDCEHTGVRGSSLNVLLRLLEDYSNLYGYDMALYGENNHLEEVEFVDRLEPVNV